HQGIEVERLSSEARRGARATAAFLFVIAILTFSLASPVAGAQARARSARAGKRQRAARAKAKAKSGREARREAPAKGRVEPYEPTDGKEEEGDKIGGREEWFRMRRGMGSAAEKGDARRKAWESRPKGKLKGDPSRGIMAASAFQWRPLGPAPTTPKFVGSWGTVSGRINTVAVKPNDGNVILVGASTGGIWRSADAGGTFVPVSDSQVDLSVGSIAFAPSSPNVVYAGMGDHANSYFGTGVLKSVDGGVTWARVSRLYDTDCTQLPAQGQPGCLPARGIARKILVHPTDPSRVFLAQSGQLADSGMIAGGFSYSTDGGVNWATTFRGQVRDLAIHPTNPQILYLTNLTTDYPGDKLRHGLYRSTDGG
ncbi:MAG: hypothetical protein LC802_21435, partial [Acidobacteria bacterium]|nr:hypothetical protein [Acidobacteriota bacterium]